MKISILTLFPEMFAGPFDTSILKRAQEKGKVNFNLINIRDFGVGDHKMVDDTPYGGGIGMVLKVDVLHQAIEHALAQYPEIPRTQTKVILTSASGHTYNQTTAKSYTTLDHLIIICGHYEGVDARVLKYVDDEVSIGDFVLTGGELPAMLITDSVTRLLEGVITEGATEEESFSQPLLEYPHYTKPRSYDEMEVPEVLLSGNHKHIAEWRHKESLKKTEAIRPDLLNKT